MKTRGTSARLTRRAAAVTLAVAEPRRFAVSLEPCGEGKVAALVVTFAAVDAACLRACSVSAAKQTARVSALSLPELARPSGRLSLATAATSGRPASMARPAYGATKPSAKTSCKGAARRSYGLRLVRRFGFYEGRRAGFAVRLLGEGRPEVRRLASGQRVVGSVACAKRARGQTTAQEDVRSGFSLKPFGGRL